MTYSSQPCGEGDAIGTDLAALVQTVAANILRPQVAAQTGWRECRRVAHALPDRQLAGKVLFLVD